MSDSKTLMDLAVQMQNASELLVAESETVKKKEREVAISEGLSPFGDLRLFLQTDFKWVYVACALVEAIPLTPLAADFISFVSKNAGLLPTVPKP